jgi:hypothetical protein
LDVCLYVHLYVYLYVRLYVRLHVCLYGLIVVLLSKVYSAMVAIGLSIPAEVRGFGGFGLSVLHEV